MLTTDPDKARAVGRKALDIYLNLQNYLNSWKRLGFTDDDVERPGSDRLVDAVVAYGTPEDIATRLTQHLDAGADHVAIQVLDRRRTNSCPHWPNSPGRLAFEPKIEREMTDPSLLKPDLGRYGVWTSGPVTPEQAAEIERLGYGAVWVGGSPAAELEFVEPILERTENRYAGHRDRQHLVRPRRAGRHVLPAHRGGLSGPVPAGRRCRPSGAHPGVPEAVRGPGGLPRRAGQVQRCPPAAGSSRRWDPRC